MATSPLMGSMTILSSARPASSDTRRPSTMRAVEPDEFGVDGDGAVVVEHRIGVDLSNCEREFDRMPIRDERLIEMGRITTGRPEVVDTLERQRAHHTADRLRRDRDPDLVMLDDPTGEHRQGQPPSWRASRPRSTGASWRTQGGTQAGRRAGIEVLVDAGLVDDGRWHLRYVLDEVSEFAKTIPDPGTSTSAHWPVMVVVRPTRSVVALKSMSNGKVVPVEDEPERARAAHMAPDEHRNGPVVERLCPSRHGERGHDRFLPHRSGPTERP